MSERKRNRRAEKKGHAGREYWGPRKPPMGDPGRATKKATHAKARAAQQRALLKLNEADLPKQEAM